MHKKFIYLCALLLSIPLSGIAIELSVSPLLTELQVRPGAKEQFEFTVNSNEKGNITVHLYNMSQKPSGHMEFTEGNCKPPKLSPAPI